MNRQELCDTLQKTVEDKVPKIEIYELDWIVPEYYRQTWDSLEKGIVAIVCVNERYDIIL